MKVILIPVADRPECRVALEQAFTLASELGANVAGCHLRPHREDQAKARKPRFLLRIGADASSDAPTAKQSALRAREAASLFAATAERHGFELVKKARLGMAHGAIWSEMVGSLDKLFPIIGPVADLSVVSRPKLGARGRGSDFLLSALLQSGKPVLVLPQSRAKPVGKHVLIAWNQSTEAARAVTAALPILSRAVAVHICSCGPETRNGPKSSFLAQYLRFWGIKTSHTTTKGRNVEQELAAAYAETGSDLILMGAYSRSRMREVVFGGVTQHLLFETNVPVLALHS
jgi:nucleotide-binding universal stress UspA family protein